MGEIQVPKARQVTCCNGLCYKWCLTSDIDSPLVTCIQHCLLLHMVPTGVVKTCTNHVDHFITTELGVCIVGLLCCFEIVILCSHNRLSKKLFHLKI